MQRKSIIILVFLSGLVNLAFNIIWKKRRFETGNGSSSQNDKAIRFSDLEEDNNGTRTITVSTDSGFQWPPAKELVSSPSQNDESIRFSHLEEDNNSTRIITVSTENSTQWPPSKEFVSSIAKDNLLIVTAVNCGYLDFFENWVDSVRKLGITHVLVFAMDETTYKSIHNYWPGHVIWPVEVFGNISVGHAGKYGDGNFKKAVLDRPNFVKAILDLGVDVLYSDIDMSWKKDPIKFIQDNLHTDLAIQDDSPRQMNMCTCFMWLRSNDVNRDLMADWNKRILSKKNAHTNQEQFNAAVTSFKRTKEKDFNWTLIDKNKFPSGNRIRKLNPTQLKDVYVIHANWVKGREAKIQSLQKYSAWAPKGKLAPCEPVKSS